MAKKKTTTARKSRSVRPRTTVHVLFSCVGRRVELIDAFRRAAKKLGIEIVTHGADIGMNAPAMHRVDHAHVVPRVADIGWASAMLDIIQTHHIGMVIPLLDVELLRWAELRARFARHGCNVVVSSKRVVEICTDKMLTHKTLVSADIDTPATWTVSAVRRRRTHRFPYFLKPRRGSAGMGNYRIGNVKELSVIGDRVPDAIVQEFIDGDEYTVDVYTGMDGVPRCAVPRRRMEVRAGEVSKGVTARHLRVMDAATRVARAFRSCRGVVTVQCITTPDGRTCVIEINPRFGGGVPLAIRAGADFPRWLLAEHIRRPQEIKPAGFIDGLTMLRYDQSVFCKLKNPAPQ